MRAFLVFVVAFLIAACDSQASAQPPVRDRVTAAALMETKTVALLDMSPLGLYPRCSGVWVSGRTILTALHCVHDQAVIGYAVHDDVYPNGSKAVDPVMQPRAAVTYLIDPVHDLALLRAVHPPAGHGVAYLRIGSVLQGMRAQTLGHSLGNWYSFSSGDVAAVRVADLEDDGHEALWVQCTTPTSPGNSGGGLFDSEGALIGVADAVGNEGQQINWYVHPQYIEALLARARKAGAL